MEPERNVEQIIEEIKISSAKPNLLLAYKFIVDSTWHSLEDKPTEPDRVGNIYIAPPKPLQSVTSSPPWTGPAPSEENLNIDTSILFYPIS